MRIRFTPLALEEHFDAIKYIQKNNPQAAWKYLQHVETVLQRLQQLPNSGRSLPEHPDLPYREVIIPSYRYIYRVVESTVWIMTVWHEARPLKKLSDF